MASDVITPVLAEQIKQDVLKVLRKHGLWYSVKEENKPDLRMIEIQTSIRVG